MLDKKYLGANGHRLTKQLFIEYRWDNKDTDYALYTLAKYDREVEGTVYPSLYRLYMEAGDITEARFVEEHLYDRQQWDQLCNSHFFRDLVPEWRSDLALKVTGELVDILVSDARDPVSKSSSSSAKYLLDNVVKEKVTATTKRGRPSNKDKNTNVISLSEEIKSDLRRALGDAD